MCDMCVAMRTLRSCQIPQASSDMPRFHNPQSIFWQEKEALWYQCPLLTCCLLAVEQHRLHSPSVSVYLHHHKTASSRPVLSIKRPMSHLVTNAEGKTTLHLCLHKIKEPKFSRSSWSRCATPEHVTASCCVQGNVLVPTIATGAGKAFNASANGLVDSNQHYQCASERITLSSSRWQQMQRFMCWIQCLD